MRMNAITGRKIDRPTEMSTRAPGADGQAPNAMGLDTAPSNEFHPAFMLLLITLWQIR